MKYACRTSDLKLLRRLEEESLVMSRSLYNVQLAKTNKEASAKKMKLTATLRKLRLQIRELKNFCASN